MYNVIKPKTKPNSLLKFLWILLQNNEHFSDIIQDTQTQYFDRGKLTDHK